VRARPYFSVCTIYRDQADALAEWIEFHRLVGAERFFLYDNFSSDTHREILAPYLEEGTVVLHEWPVEFPLAITTAFDHCIKEHCGESRWIAFLDIDEFLFSPTYEPVAKLLTEFEEWPGVGVNWALFGSSGHRSSPQGLVLENYLHRAAEMTRPIKSIVDPSRVLRSLNAHHFAYREGAGSAVDENKRPIDGWITESTSFTRLRVNHYYTKSEEDAMRKVELWSTKTTRPLAKEDLLSTAARFNEVLDETITYYVPRLREALARRASERGPER
jgi:Glycosyltransferase family 92